MQQYNHLQIESNYKATFESTVADQSIYQSKLQYSQRNTFDDKNAFFSNFTMHSSIIYKTFEPPIINNFQHAPAITSDTNNNTKRRHYKNDHRNRISMILLVRKSLFCLILVSFSHHRSCHSLMKSSLSIDISVTRRRLINQCPSSSSSSSSSTSTSTSTSTSFLSMVLAQDPPNSSGPKTNNAKRYSDNSEFTESSNDTNNSNNRNDNGNEYIKNDNNSMND